MDDGNEGLTDIDRAIAQALDVEPSADFQALVRQRVAGERMRVPLWRRQLLWIPAVAAAAILVVAVLRPAPRPATFAPDLKVGPTNSGVMPDLKVGPTKGGGPVDLNVGRSRRPDLQVGRDQVGRDQVGRDQVGRVQVGPVATARRTQQPEVLVPRDEIEMYRRLIAGARAVPGAVVVEAPADVAANRTFADIAIDPITIDLIVPPEGGEGVRQ